MSTPEEIEARFWSALASDRTIMLGLRDVEHGHTRPMTGQLDGNRGPIYIFTTKDNTIVENLGRSDSAIATFVSKGHDVFAAIEGTVAIETNLALVDRLWNPYVAAWYEHGKSDPKLALVRFDAASAQIWIDASSVVAGLKVMLGFDPKADYKDKVANVSLA